MPIALEIYDQDGKPGIHVPQSQFQKGAKEGLQSISTSSGRGGSSGAYYGGTGQQGILIELIRSVREAGTALTRTLVGENKAIIKNNTIIYLVGNDQIN